MSVIESTRVLELLKERAAQGKTITTAPMLARLMSQPLEWCRTHLVRLADFGDIQAQLVGVCPTEGCGDPVKLTELLKLSSGVTVTKRCRSCQRDHAFVREDCFVEYITAAPPPKANGESWGDATTSPHRTPDGPTSRDPFRDYSPDDAKVLVGAPANPAENLEKKEEPLLKRVPKLLWCGLIAVIGFFAKSYFGAFIDSDRAKELSVAIVHGIVGFLGGAAK